VRVREDHQVRRQRILDEAIRAVGRLGYQGLTVQALAQACGLTNAGLLHYFGSKEQLLVAVLEEHDRREAEAVPREVAFELRSAPDSQPSRATVLAILHAIVARTAAQPELARLYTVLQAEALNAAHPAHGYFLRRQAMVLGQFAGMLGGHVAAPEAVARELVALLDGLAHQWLRAEQAFDLVTACDAAVARLLPADLAGDRHDL